MLLHDWLSNSFLSTADTFIADENVLKLAIFSNSASWYVHCIMFAFQNVNENVSYNLAVLVVDIRTNLCSL